MFQNPHVSEMIPENFSEIIQVLTANQLPTEDISEQIDFFSWKEDEKLIGIGGLEQYGKTGLLRSVAILAPYKGQGLGTEWTKKLLHVAGQRGIKELFLLTTTAEKFFQSLGFQRIDRAVVPDSIRNTTEFASVCPASAAVMSLNLSAWTETDSQIFSDYSDFFVPERNTQYQIIGDWLGSVNSLDKAIDLCCGDGKLCGYLLDRFPNLKMTGLDGSEYMLKTGRQNLHGMGSRFHTQLFQLEENNWRTSFQNLDAVVSSLAIHHLDESQKKALFFDIYQMLNPGGVLVIADIIRPASEAGDTIAAEAWDHYVKQKADQAGKPEIFDLFVRDNWNYFRDPDGDPVDKPSRLLDQLNWLKEAGFEEVDVSWVFAGHAIFGGRKNR